MDIVRSSIKYPVTVTVGIVLLVLFGLLSLFAIPIQLTPDVDRPTITVETEWLGASPQEIESEIVIEQEDTLKNVEGLRRMKSESQDSEGRVELEFPVGTDIDTALLKISNRLQQVSEYPPEAERPVIISASEQIPPIAWMHVTTLPGADVDVWNQRRFFDETIRPMLERVPGVAKSNLYGGRDTIMDVVLDIEKMASLNVTFDDVVRSLQKENQNFSAGNFDEGKRRYIARTVGQFQKPEEIDEVVIKDISGAPVKIKDIGKARLGHDQLRNITMGFFKPSLALNLIREPGANVMKVMAEYKKTLKEINEEILAPRGMKIIQVYDETDYINGAIRLVRNNIFIGGTLAILVLLLFLGSIRSTLIIATAIPVSIIGTMLCMGLLGRNINVISLAGMSFAAGMVVDNSIVVLENIFRHREMGESRIDAAYNGTKEVWGAVLASTLTTMAVFIPVAFVQDEAGQLFRDIAISISAAVGISLMVSVTLIPSLSARILTVSTRNSREGKHHLIGKMLSAPFAAVRDKVVALSDKIIGRRMLEVLVVLVLTAVSIGAAYFLSPKAEYLPEGNRNLVFGILIPPPGYNLDKLKEIGDFVGDRVKPLYKVEPGSAKDKENKGVGIKHYFYWATPERVFMGLLSRDPDKVNELVPILREALDEVPGMISIVTRPSLFSRRIGEGRSINIELTGPDLAKLIRIGKKIFGQLKGLIPGVQVRPVPGLDLGNPEIKIVPNRERLAQLNMNTSDIGQYVDSLLQGRKIDEYLLNGEKIDLKVSAGDTYVSRTQDFASLPIRTPDNKLVRLGDVADIELIAGPTQINRIERRRSIELVAIPPAQVPIEEAMDTIRNKIQRPMVESGEIGGAYHFKMAGTADDLSRTRQSFQRNFVLALVITYLLMAALFENWLYPFLIMFTVPVAAGGGFVGLYLVNAFIAYQPLDILTMLGFVILVGTVVNNAILIVHQALNNIRDKGMERREALVDSVRTRVRPIVMSTSTSVMAMMPLILFPGPGSEMYRGIGSVVVGGLVLSTVFTLFLIPSFTSLMWGVGDRLFAKQV
jgi:HAE1 family hydrophobic/amphiphilic exporter-1